MLYIAFGFMIMLMNRLGLFDEWFYYRELRLLDEVVMQSADDADWEDRMARFRADHPELQERSWMRLGAGDGF